VRERFFGWLTFLRLVQYGASALIFDPEGRVLLVKHRLRGGWEWPAGGGKLGEPPHKAVMREIKEETGVALEQPRLVAIHVRSLPALAARFNFTFAEQISTEAAKTAKFDRLELSDMRWVEVEAARQLLSRRLIKRFDASLGAWHDGSVAYLTSQD
jgi:8-oxo-dGTP pyrophosphatase MutT (NUDIX family)